MKSPLPPDATTRWSRRFWRSFWQRHRQLILVLLFLATLLLAVQLTGLRQHFSLPYLRQQLAAGKTVGLLVFVLLFVLGNLAQVPGWVFLASAVVVLGKVGGGFATYVAACSACAVSFLTVRLIGGSAARTLNHRFARKLLAELDAHPLRNVIVLRTVFQTLPVLNFTLAMSGMRFRDYMLGTLAGLPLPIAAYCLLVDFIAKQTQ